MMKRLLLLMFIAPVYLLADWSSSPFDYVPEANTSKSSRYEFSKQKVVEAKKETSIEKTVNQERVPASVVSPVRSRTAKKKKKTTAPVKTTTQVLDPNWEKIKKNFEANEFKESVRAPSSDDKISSSKEKEIEKSIVEFQVGASFQNFKASSGYYPMNYSSQANQLFMQGNIQFTKDWGAYSKYYQSFSLSVKDDNAATGFVDFDSTSLEFGAIKNASISSKRASMQYILGYREWSVLFPKSSSYRLGHKLNSLILGLNLKWSKTEDGFWKLHFNLIPYANYSQEDSSWSSEAGTDPSFWGQEMGLSYNLNLSDELLLGFHFDYSHQSLSFKGSSGAADPVGGSTINRVKVNFESSSFGVNLLWNY
jgi:hypothetical protein